MEEKEQLGKNDDPDEKCGCYSWRPKFLERFGNMKIFTSLLALVVLSQGGISTYLMAVMSTIEKAIKITSKKSGFIASANDIGYLATVVLASYLASRAHKPRVIGIASIIFAVGAFLSGTPYFIFGGEMSVDNYDVADNGIHTITVVTLNDSLLDIDGPNELSHRAPVCIPPSLKGYVNANATCDAGGKVEEESNDSMGAYVIMIISQIIIGVAVSPIWPLGMTFIDDNVSKYSAPVYLGVLFGIRLLSPAVGFGIGAIMTALPINLKTHPFLKSGDPEWIGAWWLGFVGLGILIFFVSLPMIIFPRRLRVKEPDPAKEALKKKKKEEKEAKRIAKGKKVRRVSTPMMFMNTENGGNDTDEINIKGFLLTLKRLLSNKVYILIVCGSIINMFYIMGTVPFMPKYIENQFYLSAAKASLAFGMLSAVPLALGTILGGILVGKLKMDSEQMALTSFILALLTTCVSFPMIAFGCPEPKIEGLVAKETLNLTQSCNTNCDCSTLSFNPVCGDDDITYYSPCFAGCTQGFQNGTYTNCSCIPSGIGQYGYCHIDRCQMFIPFMILQCLAAFVSAFGFVPGLLLLFRIVDIKDKAVALGFLTFIVSVLAGIPAPVTLGALIDSVCVMHHQCHHDVCLLYSNKGLRYKFYGIAQLLRVGHILVASGVWGILKYRKWKQNKLDKKIAGLSKHDTEDEVELANYKV